MNNCKTCKHAIFCKRMGEYKCRVHCRYMRWLLTPGECSWYVKGEPEDSKEDEDEGGD